nr:DUF1385 domain-containing protein [Desulfobacterales bacterium]
MELNKSIYKYEAGGEVFVENARKFSTLHPRCGTAFILIVILLTILCYSLIFSILAKMGCCS